MPDNLPGNHFNGSIVQYGAGNSTATCTISEAGAITATNIDISSGSFNLPKTYRMEVPVQTLSPTAGTPFANVLNPFGEAVIITNCVFVITTQSTGASTLDIGVAADSVTNSDVLLDGVSGAATGAFDNVKNAGTNGRSGVLMSTSQYLVIAEASGDAAGIAGYIVITAVRQAA